MTLYELIYQPWTPVHWFFTGWTAATLTFVLVFLLLQKASR